MFASSVFVRPLITALPLAAALLIACGDAHETTDDATGDGTETGDDTDDAATTEGTTDDATTTEGATTDDATTDDATTDDATTDASESDTSDTTGEPESPELPIPTAACPEIIDGEVTFAPAGLDKERTVRIWIDEDAAAEADGPVVFYWHGTGSSPQEAQYGLSPAGVAAITAAGGAVIAPIHDPDAGTFPWFLVLDANREDDLILADEVLACLQEQHGVDARRIHVAGMSAGGLQTTQMSFRRSGYIASAASYSGGLIVESVPDQDPDNPFSAMIFHGGASDQVVVEFQQTSELYFDVLAARGSFAFLCDHGMGHTIPSDGGPAVVQFFSDHPYKTRPSPYADGLPASFPSYCALP